MELNKTFVDLVQQPLIRTWQAIGPDIGLSMPFDEITNEEVIEMCTDADHLEMYGESKEAAEAMHAAYAEHGDEVFEFLAEHIQVL
jgi:hypothetical protein